MDWSDKLLYGSFVFSMLLLNFKAQITYWTLLFSRLCIPGANLPAPEDKVFIKLKKGGELKEDDPILSEINKPDHADIRINKILVNESQSFTFFLLNSVAFLFMFQISRGTVVNQVSSIFGSCCFAFYVLFRYLYYFFYLFQLQPYRTLSFVVANFIQVLMGLYTGVVFIVAVAIY